LKRVLRAFVARHSALGYAQGMNFLALFLLAFLDEEETFWTVSYIVSRLRPLDFYSGAPFDMNGMRTTLDTIVTLAAKLKLVDEHVGEMLMDEGCSVEDSIKMSCSAQLPVLFIDQLPMSSLLRFWNAFLAEGKGDLASILTSLAITKHANNLLMQVDEDEKEERQKLSESTRKGLGEDPNNSAEPIERKMSIQKLRVFRDASGSLPLSLLENALTMNEKDGWPTKAMVEKARFAQSAKEAKSLAQETIDLYSLLKATKITCADIKKYQTAFRTITKGAESYALNQDQFVRILKHGSSIKEDNVQQGSRRSHISKDLARALFLVADRDGDGGVDFRELMVSLSLLGEGPSSSKERLRLLFQAFDRNGDGLLAKSELRALATILVKHQLRATHSRQPTARANKHGTLTSPIPSRDWSTAVKSNGSIERGPQQIAKMLNQLLSLDTDESGGLSYPELEAGIDKCPELAKLLEDMHIETAFDGLLNTGVEARRRPKHRDDTALCRCLIM